MLKRRFALLRSTRWLAGVITAVVLAAAVAWLLFVPAADWLAHHDVGSAREPLLQTARDAARGRLLTLGAGLLAAGALLFTARNFTLSREGQVTDRYTKAIEQLGSDKLDVRIGGIYALERVARDSARDHSTVMEVLAAFIREHSREPWPPSDSGSQEQARSARPDILAAIAVVGRRDPKRDIQRIDLGGANLAGADFAFVDLMAANLTGANLAGARLMTANLRYADLARANLTDADLTRANLTDADLTDARLGGARLGSANLTDANLTGADLTGTRLTGADLTDVILTDANLTGVRLGGARWPEDTPVPEGWKLDTGSGRLERAGADSGPSEAGGRL